MNQISVFFLTITLAGILSMGCNTHINTSNETDNQSDATFDLAAMKVIIKEKSDKFTQAHITRDTAYLNNIFALDAKAYPPNSEPVIGRAAISAVNLDWVNYGIKEFTEESTSFYGNEEYLIDEGRYYLRFGEEDFIDRGNYINIWKKENGDWKMFSNIWNTSLPATASE